MGKLICIIGTDGSGKTTLADTVVEALSARGKPARRVWLGAESYMMAPVRSILKLAWRHPDAKRKASGPKPGAASQRTDYAAEIERKNAFARRHAWAVRIYLALVWADYRLQLAVKRWRTRGAGMIVADRYLFDAAVNLGLTLGWSPDEVVAFLRRRLAKIELPMVRVFLRVEPEISMARKDDVFDIDYLRLRLRYYDAIARAFGFTVRDGTLPIEMNRDWLLADLRAEMARPYVLYVHANNADIGGADKVLALMARHMRDHGRPEGGNRVAVVLRLQTAIIDSYANDGIPVIHHAFVRPQVSRGAAGISRLLFTTPGTLWFFWRLFGRERPDIVHVNDLYDFLPALAARWRGVPVVWHIRMIQPSRRLRTAFAWLVSRLAPMSISVSQAVRDHYFPEPMAGHVALVIHDLGNAALIADDRDPTDTGPWPAGLPDGRRLVLMVGRIEPWKGQHVFIEAVHALAPELRADTVFALVGGKVGAKEDYFVEVTRMAREAGVSMLGARGDVPALLRAADISVHASVTPDPFPGVVVESLLAGAATIAARAGGATEMIGNTTQGILTPPGDAKALSAALAALLAALNPPRTRFGVAARARALSLVDALVVDSAVEAAYERLTEPLRHRGQKELGRT